MSLERKFLHDLSSPLTAIQLNLENALEMLKEGAPDGQRGCAEMISSSLGQMEKAMELMRARREVLIKGGQ
jgi:hypothetical protein